MDEKADRLFFRFSSCEGVFESHVEYTFKMDQLRNELLKQQAQKPTASFFNIEVFKYQVKLAASYCYVAHLKPCVINLVFATF